MKNKFFIFLFASMVFAAPFCLKAQIITTIAGNGIGGYSGDGGPATAAEFQGGTGAARLDGTGNIYIPDLYNSRVRKVNSAGIITTIAGNGTTIHSGDGGPATDAGIIAPQSLAIDGSGNLYIVEDSNYSEIGNAGTIWIRKVNTAGIITTIAGGNFHYSGDGGPATAAGFDVVADISADNMGNVYIADEGRLRKVNSAGIITTIAGNGSNSGFGDGGPATAAGLSDPLGIAVDDKGDTYIVDYGNSYIRKINPAGIINSIAGDGMNGYNGDGAPATTAELQQPIGVAVDGDGNVYIADYFNNRIRKINTAGIISTIAGNGTGGYNGDGAPATTAELDFPSGVAVDGIGNVYITDNNRIRKVSLLNTGVITPILSTSDVKVYPNPANDELNITGITGTTNYRLLTVTGVTVQEGVLQQGNNTVSVQKYAPGIYILEMTGAGGKRNIVRVVVY